MRVTHVITRLIVGGAQENTIATVLGLRNTPGVSVQLISGPTTGPEGSLESALDTGFNPPLLTVLPELVRPVHPWKDLAALRRLTKMFRATSPDIVHTHSGKAGVLGRLAAARTGVPIIVHTIHGPSFGPFQGAAANFIFRAAERRAARVTTHFVVVADAVKHQYLAAGIGQPRQYTKVFSGFDLDPFLKAENNPELRSKFGLQPDDVVVGKIARLFKLKGHDDLFAVAPQLVRHDPRIKFLLVGGGEWQGRFQNLARSLGLEKHFVFAGLVPPAEIPTLIGIMDLVVHLSRREGLPRALPQALAAARPVVAYDCDGASEVCRDDETGFLIPAGDKGKLINRVQLLAENKDLRIRLGRSGQAFIREHFSIQIMVNSIRHLYQKLAAERGLAR